MNDMVLRNHVHSLKILQQELRVSLPQLSIDTWSVFVIVLLLRSELNKNGRSSSPIKSHLTFQSRSIAAGWQTLAFLGDQVYIVLGFWSVKQFNACKGDSSINFPGTRLFYEYSTGIRSGNADWGVWLPCQERNSVLGCLVDDRSLISL